MSNILHRVKKMTSLAALSAVIFGTLLSATGVQASGPQFNFLPGDNALTVARTQGMTSYANPLSANVNDTVTVAVYYHNGVENTVAENTRVTVTLPTGSASVQTVQTTLSADNAAAITATVVNGQTVGQPDLTIDLNQPATVSYVPGSTRWFPDLQQNPNETGIQMPDGITSPSGLVLGNIQGCWAHAGYVLFNLVFSQQVLLQTNKQVAVFGGNDVWAKQDTASAGDVLRYQIYYNNNGNTSATGAQIVDQLPTGVTYQSGSVSKRTKDANNNDVNTIIPDNQLTISGQTLTIPLGNILPGQNNSGFIYLRAQIDPNLAVGTTVLTNNEQLEASNTPTVSSSATTTVTVTPTPVPDLGILKEVDNLSQNANTWVAQDTAQPGDTLEFRITIYNQGTGPADNVSVKDILPNYLSYVSGSTKIYTTDPNSGVVLPDGLTNAGLSVGTIQNGVPQGNRYLTFEAKVAGVMPGGNTDLINTAQVYLGGVLKGTSTTDTTVTSQVGLLLTKSVWNASTGQWVNQLSGVKPGDTLSYQIMVRNTGNTTIDNPVIKDSLPNLEEYVPGSTLMDGSVSVNDTWITQGNGILIANVTPGNYKIITFQAIVKACPPGGTYTEVNTATVSAAGLSTQSASATVVISAGAPGIPL